MLKLFAIHLRLNTLSDSTRQTAESFYIFLYDFLRFLTLFPTTFCSNLTLFPTTFCKKVFLLILQKNICII